jgi:hypothetical protein
MNRVVAVTAGPAAIIAISASCHAYTNHSRQGNICSSVSNPKAQNNKNRTFKESPAQKRVTELLGPLRQVLFVNSKGGMGNNSTRDCFTNNQLRVVFTFPWERSKTTRECVKSFVEKAATPQTVSQKTMGRIGTLAYCMKNYVDRILILK